MHSNQTLGTEITASLEAMHRKWKKANSNVDRDACLLGALWLCRLRPLPDWLHEALDDLLTARLPKALRRDRRRWVLVREGHEHGLTWDDAYAYASEQLAGSDAQGSPRTMKWSYQNIQRDMRRR